MPRPTESSPPPTTTVPWAGMITVLLTIAYLVGSIGLAGERIPLVWRYQGEWHKLSARFSGGGSKRTPSARSNQRRIPHDQLFPDFETVNPFLKAAGREVQAPHPLIEMTGVHVHPAVGVRPKLDYLGFRNHHGMSIYTNRVEGILVAFFGNSEGAGYMHRVPIAELMERDLRMRGIQATVMNLALNGQHLNQSINIYNQLAYDLKPDFVVAHLGGGEFHFTRATARPLVELGMQHSPQSLTFAVRAGGDLASLNPEEANYIFRTDTQLGLRPTTERIRRFARMIRANGGELIFGFQKIDPNHRGGGFNYGGSVEFLRRIHDDLPAGELSRIWFQDDDRIEMVDPIHSANEAAAIIAGVYADHIARELGK